MHNLQLTEDQEMVVDTVRKLVADAVTPKVQELDEHRGFARDWFVALSELGVYGLSLSEEKGGAGMGLLPFVAALESVGEQSGSLARLWIGQMQAALALENTGSDLLDEVAGGEKLVTFVGREHGFTVADGKLTGKALMVPAAMEADLMIVAATDGDTTVLVSVETAACERCALRGLGLNSAACGAVACEGVAATVLATGDDATTAIERAELAAWLGVAAASVGGAIGSIEAAKKHAGERIAFGKPLLVQQAVQRKLVECGRAVAAARQLTWHAARLADLGECAKTAAMQARIAAVDAMVLTADESIQIHGGFGYTVEYHVERHYRDGKTFEVLDGGNDSLRDRLATASFA
ncbi:MAG: butyryl-CoA dehydrogenase [Planctomycetota bacterium]|jgi:butyryl-CoA dehydrogenase